MTSEHVTQVTEQNFDSEVMTSEKLVLIDFYADWCGPCKTMAPRIEEFAAENTDIKVVKVNVDQSASIAAAFGVKSIPTLVTMMNGVAVFGAVGAVPKNGIAKLVDDSFKSINTMHASKPQQHPHDPIL